MDNKKIQELYVEALKLVTFFNRPENDKFLIESNNINLDFKLFPLFVAISKLQPTTVQKLSSFSGRPHSTISRQVQRLESAELINTTVNTEDSRSHFIKLSFTGEMLSDKIKKARIETIKQTLNNITDDQQETILASLKLLNRIILAKTAENK
ncbi:MarR family transcriptional regulator [Lactobacillus sp. UCMA15818]|uniref:MarR family winged helix-turn-helix transcriptional regulator n=1 Tax=Lactobacillus sp. UCMA15818 TaxID=2583394 RepID=UPI0025B27531|nr:MarR family transcriptional regulator [Lactobacillus sp. UCMA15818]